MPLVCTRRLCIGDIDAAGIAYTGRLVDFALETLEIGCAAQGLDFAALLREGRFGLPLVHIEADFAAPFRHGDQAECHLFCEAISERSYTSRIELRRSGSERAAASLRFTAACVDLTTLRSTALPESIRTVLERLRQPAG
jgi:acyl-CoA thioesterase FadM